MNTLVSDLLVLQKFLAGGGAAEPDGKAKLTRLGARLPSSVLAHALRQHACGRAGIALVRHGVCGACHIRVAHGTLQSLAHPTDLHLCENCGSFLALAPDEAPTASEPSRPTQLPPRPVGRPARRRPVPELVA